MTDYVRVTDSPDLETRLRDQLDVLSSRQLAEYAHSLGLYPPGYDDGSDPPIVLVWPPDMPDDADGIIMWDLAPDQD